MSKKFEHDKLNKWDRDLKKWESSDYYYSDEVHEDEEYEDEEYES